MMEIARPVALRIASESDIARARSAGREISQALGASAVSLQKVVTIASELARNMILYAGGGDMSMEPRAGDRPAVRIVARDRGPGIPFIADVFAGRYTSRTGLGLGLLGSKRLADRFEVETGSAGTCIVAEVTWISEMTTRQRRCHE